MKRIDAFLKGCCAYTVVILTFFYLFALANDFTETRISFGRFALIFLFGAVCCAAQYIFELKVHKLIALALHYCVLLFAFSMIFLVSGVLGTAGSKIFVATIVFTILYAVLFCAFYFLYRGIAGLDKRLDGKHPKKTVQKSSQKSSQKSEYNPRFK